MTSFVWPQSPPMFNGFNRTSNNNSNKSVRTKRSFATADAGDHVVDADASRDATEISHCAKRRPTEEPPTVVNATQQSPLSLYGASTVNSDWMPGDKREFSWFDNEREKRRRTFEEIDSAPIVTPVDVDSDSGLGSVDNNSSSVSSLIPYRPTSRTESTAVVLSTEARPSSTISTITATSSASSSQPWQSSSPVWLLLPIGGRTSNDGTPHFLSLLGQCSRISIVQASARDTPLELLTSIDSSSRSFAPACRYLESHAHNFSSLNLGVRYNTENTSGTDRQLVARVAGASSSSSSYATSLCLWPTAMAFNRFSKELIVLVASDRANVPWERINNYFNN